MATVTVELREFDELRDKAKKYDELKEKYDNFPQVLKSRMANVLSKVIEINAGVEDYSKMPKLNTCHIEVSPDILVIQKMEVRIDKPNEGGYYNAKIICHYK